MNYEIQIYTKDKTKVIKFKDNELEAPNLNKLLTWEDFYYAMGAVIDDKADSFQENNTLIGRLNAYDIYYDEVIDIMCEDLSPELIRILTQDEEISVLA
jgi:hypothetical protein